MKNLYKLTGIKQTKTTPYHPMGNGLSERFNHTLLSMVGTLTSEKKKAWPKYLPVFVKLGTRNTATPKKNSHFFFFWVFLWARIGRQIGNIGRRKRNM